MKRVISPRQFEALFVLRDELHFGRAAIRLGVAQPHLSATLRRVEEVVGFSIFERRPAVRLTPAGAVLLKAGAHMLAEVEAGIAEARMVAAGTKGIVRIGYIPAAIFAGLADAVTLFARDNPLVEFTLREAPAPSLYEQLSRGDLDLIVVRADGSTQPLQSVKLLEERMLAMLPDGHPVSGCDPISLERLNDDRFIFFRRSGAREYVDRLMSAAQNAGFKPAHIQEVDSWMSAAALVRSGFGITLATSVHQTFAVPGVRFCAIKEALPDVSFHLYFDPARIPASAAEFIKVLQRVSSTLGCEGQSR